jgi:hypothetical protein
MNIFTCCDFAEDDINPSICDNKNASIDPFVSASKAFEKDFYQIIDDFNTVYRNKIRDLKCKI